MSSRADELKTLRWQKEGDFINLEWVEMLAKCVTDDLVAWANENIFASLGGELTLNIPAFGPPNARTITYWNRIYNPTIEIRLSLLKEIYRDAFTFPLISNRLADETDTIRNLHKSFEGFKETEPFVFSSGIPDIPLALCGNLKLHCLAVLDVTSKNRDPRMSDNDVICRFVMFEVMLAWTFFHELGHIVQRHFMLGGKAIASDSTSVEISEMSETGTEHESNVLGQAREILADVEGLDLTFKYMVRKGIYAPASVYLLLCAQNCMFHRFYQIYADNLDLTSGEHPHPVIRNEFAHNYVMKWAVDERKRKGLIHEVSEVAIPLTYTSVRSSLMAGLFWANRIEKYDGSRLPSYMTLSTQDHQAKRESYVAILTSAIREQLPNIKEMHLLARNSIPLLESSLPPREP